MHLADMSLEEKAGQVFMLGFHGKSAEDARYAVCGLRAGGVIYLGRNMGTPDETARLSEGLQGLAKSATGAPLLIAVDQEGGVVSRLSAGLPGMPGAMALGAAGDPALTREVSLATGIQLRSAGINMDLAPVLDVNDNPFNPVIGVRSFGSDPEAVAQHGAAAVGGYLESGIAPAGKHFPGHGNTSVDSHLALPVIPHPFERLERVELAPFRAAVTAGLPVVMPAHIVFKALDPQRPATMSEAVLQGLLRGRLGFQGLIVTDCLEMDAVARDPGTPTAAVQALKAGADLLLVCHTREVQVAAVQAVIEAVRTGEIPESRLDEAAYRVLALKRQLRVPNPLPAAEAGSPVLRALSRRAHLASISVVRAAGGRFPVAAPSRIAVLGAPRAAGSLVRCLSEIEGIEPVRAEMPCDGASTVLLTDNAWKDHAQALWAKQVADASPGVVVVATRDPYDLRAVPHAETFICTYGPGAEAMEALAGVITGRDRATGTLPVTME